jgi:type I restriction enzyme S subunit
MATSQDFVNWICTKEIIPRFLQYLFIAEGSNLLRFASGAVHQTIYFPEAKAFHIAYPPFPEQQRIVAILDEAFDGIATAKANAEKNLQNARALVENHLQSVFTQRGAEWVEKPLSEVCVFVNGRAYKKHEMLSAGKYPLLRVGNFFTNKDWFYSDLELDPNKYCDTGDLLYAWSASFGPRIWEGGKVIYHYHIWKVLPNSAIVGKRFLLHLLEWDVEQIKRAHGTGTTMMHVSKGSMESRVVPIPPLAQQAGIVSVLDGLIAESQRLESVYQRKLAALEALKKSLLHQAFSGHL